MSQHNFFSVAISSPLCRPSYALSPMSWLPFSPLSNLLQQQCKLKTNNVAIATFFFTLAPVFVLIPRFSSVFISSVSSSLFFCLFCWETFLENESSSLFTSLLPTFLSHFIPSGGRIMLFVFHLSHMLGHYTLKCSGIRKKVCMVYFGQIFES